MDGHNNSNIEIEKKIRFKFSKTGQYKYFSHLDIIAMITKALRRAKIKIKYSKGYNPRPRLSFGPPAPLGIESNAEYCDIALRDIITEDELIRRLNDQLHKKIIIDKAMELPSCIKNIMSQTDIIEYFIYVCGDDSGSESLVKMAADIGGSDEFKGSIHDIDCAKAAGNKEAMILKLSGYAKICKDRNPKVFKLMNYLESLRKVFDGHGLSIDRIVREELYILKEEKMITPFEILKFYI